MARKWVSERKRVRTSHVKASHGVRDDHQTRSGGKPIAVTEGMFSYVVHDGNHRLRDAKARGDRYVDVEIWRPA